MIRCNENVIVCGPLTKKLMALNLACNSFRLHTDHSQSKKHHLTNVLHIIISLPNVKYYFFKMVNPSTVLQLRYSPTHKLWLHLTHFSHFLQTSFLPSCKSLKLTLILKDFLHNGASCNGHRVIQLFFFLFFSHNSQTRVLFLFRTLLNINFPLQFQFQCFLFHPQFKSN